MPAPKTQNPLAGQSRSGEKFAASGNGGGGMTGTITTKPWRLFKQQDDYPLEVGGETYQIKRDDLYKVIP